MAELKIKVAGYRFASVDSNWEIHKLDGTLHPAFSGNIDGFAIDSYRLDGHDDTMTFNWYVTNDPIQAGETINISDMLAGDIIVQFFHNSPSGHGTAKFTATGQAKYQIELQLNSMF
ncbi:hypothetical protein J2810_004633 [Chryseobacterium rhizosphaerae]|uniref:hypothetical protein n=1 Tax=Chryseobacterium rhizosphaerae TaxID=395937 RepID=UPI0028624235|nr:hypothetical protein [Chryseobacterium rhizosphaerae]MDR6548543.1 hypothetical protein [Chryseobacterium rhizosphaerae]